MSSALTATFLNPQYAVNVQQIQAGWRWCISCGTPSVPPNEPYWKTRCMDCFVTHKRTKGAVAGLAYCKQCGIELNEYIMRIQQDCCCLEHTIPIGKCKLCDCFHPIHYHHV